ncbi:hypothetical protein Tco_0576821, partial [Tanacetum coccineum]
RQILSKANLEIVAYQLGLESVEAQLVVHQKNEAVYEEKSAVLEFEVKDKSNVVTRHKNQLDETLREKDDLKAKLEQFETSSKNLNKLINSQLSAKDKTGLGYGDQLNENDLSGSKLFNSVFDSRSSDGDDNQTNDRSKKDNGYHVVHPPLTGNYMPPLAVSFAGLDDSIYRPTTNNTSASVSQVKANITPLSNASVEMPRVESIRLSGVIIAYWVSDDEDIFQSNDLQATYKHSLKRIEFTNTRNESIKPKQAEKPRIITQNPKVDRRDWNEKMTQKLGLGFGFTKKACFVCGSYSYLIKDCDFHEKRMAKKSVLKNMGKNTSQWEIRSVWNSVQRINHQNKFVPYAVLTRISNEKLNTVRVNGVNTVGQTAVSTVKETRGYTQQALKYIRNVCRGCSSICREQAYLLISSYYGGLLPLVEVTESSDDKAKDDTVDDDACKKTIQEPVSEYDQALKNVLDKMMDQEKEATEQSDAVRKEFEAQLNSVSASPGLFVPVGPSSGPSFVSFGGSLPIDVANLPHDPLMPEFR